MGWVVYMLRCGDGSLYTGATNDLQRRVEAHVNGRGARYTRGRGPLTLVFSRRYPNQSAALRAEYRLKHLSRTEKLALVKKRRART